MNRSSNHSTPLFTFADLFAGIGGFRLAFEAVGGACVLTSEIDEYARITYETQKWKNFELKHETVPDVVVLGNKSPRHIPDHDVLLAGFPCQPYSIAGLRQGLEDEKGRGQVFLSILDLLRKKQPKAFVLENVKGMLSHDGGRTIRYLFDQLSRPGRGVNYQVLEPTVLNSMIHGGVPQNRERVFLVGFRADVNPRSFKWPAAIAMKNTLEDLLEENVPEKYFYTQEKYDCYKEIKQAVTRSDTAYQWRRIYVRENKSGVCPALTANMGSGGHNVPLVKVPQGIRKLTPRECARFQGFKDSFVLPDGMSDSHLYHQFGNSVTVPLIQRIAKQVTKVLEHD